MKKRLITNIFNQLILTDEGINVYYAFADDSNNYSQIQNKKGSLDLSSDPSKSFRQPLGFFPSQNLSIVQFGGGGGNRTHVQSTFQIKYYVRSFWVSTNTIFDFYWTNKQSWLLKSNHTWSLRSLFYGRSAIVFTSFLLSVLAPQVPIRRI